MRDLVEAIIIGIIIAFMCAVIGKVLLSFSLEEWMRVFISGICLGILLLIIKITGEIDRREK